MKAKATRSRSGERHHGRTMRDTGLSRAGVKARTACRVMHAVRRLLQEPVQRARRRTWHAGIWYRALLSRQGVRTSETPPLACPLQSSQSVRTLLSVTYDL